MVIRKCLVLFILICLLISQSSWQTSLAADPENSFTHPIDHQPVTQTPDEISYESLHLIGQFGGRPGPVGFFGQYLLTGKAQIFNIHNISQSGLQSPFISIELNGILRDISVQNNFAYILSEQREAAEEYTCSIEIIDLADIRRPRFQGRFEAARYPYSTLNQVCGKIRIDRQRGFVSSENAITYLNLDIPTQPVIRSTFSNQSISGSEDSDLRPYGNYLYYTGGGGQQIIFDYSNPDSPIIAGYFGESSWTRPKSDLVIDGQYLYAAGYRHIKILNISNPVSPEYVHEIYTPGGLEGVVDIAISGSYLYLVMDLYKGINNALRGTSSVLVIYNVSNPYQPVEVQRYTWTPGEVFWHDMALSGNLLALSADCIYDLSNPEEPILWSSNANENLRNIELTSTGKIGYFSDTELISLDINQPYQPLQNIEHPRIGRVMAVDGGIAITRQSEFPSYEVSLYDLQTHPTSQNLVTLYDNQVDFGMREEDFEYLSFDLTANAGFVYIIDELLDEFNFLVYDIRNPLSPRIVHQRAFNLGSYFGSGAKIVIGSAPNYPDQTCLYLLHSNSNGIQLLIYNITLPEHLELLSSTNLAMSANYPIQAVDLDGSNLVILHGSGEPYGSNGEVGLVDISIIETPELEIVLNLNGGFSDGAVLGDTLFLANERRNKLDIFRLPDFELIATYLLPDTPQRVEVVDRMLLVSTDEAGGYVFYPQIPRQDYIHPSGGELSDPQSGIRFTFAPNTFAQTTPVIIKPLYSLSIPAPAYNQRIAGPAFSLQAGSDANPVPAEVPFTIEVPYDPAVLPQIEEQSLRLYRLFNSEWQPLEGGILDLESHILTVQTDTFGVFALVGISLNDQVVFLPISGKYTELHSDP